MKQKLATVAVITALGFTGIAQAQDPEGIKAYVTTQIVDFELVNPSTGNTVVGAPGASGTGDTDGSISVLDFLDNRDAIGGSFDTNAGDFDADQACINGVGADDLPDCPPENFYDQVLGIDSAAAPILQFTDFGRGDSLVIPAPVDQTPGDDIFLVAECQRSGTDQPKRSDGSSAAQGSSQEFQLAMGDPATQILEFRGSWTIRAGARSSANLGVTCPNPAPPPAPPLLTTSAQAGNSLRIQINRDPADGGGTVSCDTSPVEAGAAVLGPGDSQFTPVLPIENAQIALICDASDFGAGELFEPNVIYTFTSDTGTLASCTLCPPVAPEGDHWLCYKGFDNTLFEPVNLVDQFENKNYEVVKPQFMCNPADKKVGDGPTELIPAGGENNHFTGYQLAVEFDDLYTRHERQTVLVTDQFGTKTVTTARDADRLWVPSGKSLVPAAAPIPAIDHYKCYDVQVDGFEPITVGLGDQFSPTDPGPDGELGTEDDILNQWRVANPSQLCTPVQKTLPDGSVTPIADPEQHLMCYDVRRAGRQTLFGPQTVYMTNQFVAADDLLVKHEAELCVTATKELQ